VKFACAVICLLSGAGLFYQDLVKPGEKDIQWIRIVSSEADNIKKKDNVRVK